jgi:hypothetical protein
MLRFINPLQPLLEPHRQQKIGGINRPEWEPERISRREGDFLHRQSLRRGLLRRDSRADALFQYVLRQCPRGSGKSAKNFRGLFIPPSRPLLIATYAAIKMRRRKFIRNKAFPTLHPHVNLAAAAFCGRF